MKGKRKKQTKVLPKYDVVMIHDFLQHLLWELRICHFENTHKQGAINPELVDQLNRYVVKRNTVGLLPARTVDTEGVPEEAVDEAIQNLKGTLAQMMQRALDAFGVLEPFFDDALKCAAHNYGFVVIKTKLTDYLNQTE
jgi:hypothetical protein